MSTPIRHELVRSPGKRNIFEGMSEMQIRHIRGLDFRKQTDDKAQIARTKSLGRK